MVPQFISIVEVKCIFIFAKIFRIVLGGIKTVLYLFFSPWMSISASSKDRGRFLSFQYIGQILIVGHSKALFCIKELNVVSFFENLLIA